LAPLVAGMIFWAARQLGLRTLNLAMGLTGGAGDVDQEPIIPAQLERQPSLTPAAVIAALVLVPSRSVHFGRWKNFFVTAVTGRCAGLRLGASVFAAAADRPGGGLKHPAAVPTSPTSAGTVNHAEDLDHHDRADELPRHATAR